MNDDQTATAVEDSTPEDSIPENLVTAMSLIQVASILAAAGEGATDELMEAIKHDREGGEEEDSEIKACQCAKCVKCAMARMLQADRLERNQYRLADFLLEHMGHHIGEDTEGQGESAVEMAIRCSSARPRVLAAESLLGHKFDLLDHGFVRLVDYMGGDDRVVQAARTSYGKGTKTKREDRGLIRHLISNKHTSPFEQVVMTFHCKMPIFVARQWVRHRTARLNEMSGRYSELPNEFYVPDLENIQPQSKGNNQGREDQAFTIEAAKEIQGAISGFQIGAASHYHALLGKKNEYGNKHPMIYEGMDSEGRAYVGDFEGIARELARINLPLSTYTEWYWQIDLHNLMHFLSLRMDKHAQYEIRVYADVMYKIAQAVAPVSMEAFDDYVRNGSRFSKLEMDALRDMVPKKAAPPENSGMSKREELAFAAKLGIDVDAEGNWT